MFCWSSASPLGPAAPGTCEPAGGETQGPDKVWGVVAIGQETDEPAIKSQAASGQLVGLGAIVNIRIETLGGFLFRPSCFKI